MKKISIAILLLLTGRHVHGQSTRSPLATRYTATGAYSKNFTDAFSGTVNQAALAQIKEATAGVYGERRFMLKEISNYAAAIAMPTRLGGFGISARYFGGQQFNASQIGLGYGKKLHDKIDIGVQFNYNMMSLPGYGSSNTINFEAGTILHVTEQLHIGVHVYNPVGGKYGKLKSEKIASVYSTGVGYEASDKLFISSDISKEEDQPLNINVSLQYIFAESFFTRLGVASSTGSYFFGCGVKWKTCRLDAAAAWHAQLGFTPGIMLLFYFKEHEKKPGG
ncbi:MAG: hypothetical protein ABIQ88_13590 [Chitinophagaceae bacterium]